MYFCCPESAQFFLAGRRAGKLLLFLRAEEAQRAGTAGSLEQHSSLLPSPASLPNCSKPSSLHTPECQILHFPTTAQQNDFSYTWFYPLKGTHCSSKGLSKDFPPLCLDTHMSFSNQLTAPVTENGVSLQIFSAFKALLQH